MQVTDEFNLDEAFSADDLRQAGELIYGSLWSERLTVELQLSGPEVIDRWLTGAESIPPYVWDEVMRLAQIQQHQLTQLLNKLTEGAPTL